MNYIKTPNPKTALLIFSYSKEEQIKHKPFLAQKSLINALHKHTVSIAEKSDLPVIFYDETKQLGDDFGSRFSNALQRIFDDGYTNIIVIGNDCPHLSVKHILKAKKALLKNEVTIGGTTDGGFYLLGISNENFDKEKFLNFSWNETTLFNEVLQYISSKSLKYTVLQKLRDIDFYIDLESLSIDTIRNTMLRNCIVSVLRKTTKINVSKNLKKLLLLLHVIFNKGSPQLYLS